MYSYKECFLGDAQNKPQSQSLEVFCLVIFFCIVQSWNISRKVSCTSTMTVRNSWGRSLVRASGPHRSFTLICWRCREVTCLMQFPCSKAFLCNVQHRSISKTVPCKNHGTRQMSRVKPERASLCEEPCDRAKQPAQADGFRRQQVQLVTSFAPERALPAIRGWRSGIWIAVSRCPAEAGFYRRLLSVTHLSVLPNIAVSYVAFGIKASLKLVLVISRGRRTSQRRLSVKQV